MLYRRSTPSPRSLNAHIHDADDVARNRSSPSFQSGSLHPQRPLVPAVERQYQQQQKLVKIFQQPVINSADVSSVVQNNGGDASLSRGSAPQQYVDGGQGSLLRGHTQPQQQSAVHSYQEQQTISAARQQPVIMTPTSYLATQSEPSSLSSQISNQSVGGKRVRVLDASGQDVQVHAGFDATDLPQERSSLHQTSLSSHSQSVPLAAAQQTSTTTTNAYNDLEDIMAEFDVSCLKLKILKFVLSQYLILLIFSVCFPF